MVPQTLLAPAELAASEIHASPRYCPACGAMSSADERACVRCSSDCDVVSATGEVFSYALVHDGDERSYVLALVELTQGPLVMGQIVGADPDVLEIGLPVTLLVPGERGCRPSTGGLYFRPLQVA